MQHYTGRQSKLSLSNLIFFVLVGLLPTIIKVVIFLCSKKDISPDYFHAELFFFSIVLFIEALKNSARGSVRWMMSLFLVSIYSSIYTLILSSDLGLLKAGNIVSSDGILILASISIVVGIILNLIPFFYWR